MPAAPDHHRFALALLESEGSAAARPGLVLLGSQGPDPFFFRGLVPWRYRRDGARSRAFAEFAHHADPAKLFGPMAEACRASSDPEGAYRFLYGLLLHYALDASLHPYVFSSSGFDSRGLLSGGLAAAHASFETGICEALRPEDFACEPRGAVSADAVSGSLRPKFMLATVPAELELADEVLAEAFPGRVKRGEYAESWADMATILEFLWDPRGTKRELADALGLGRSHARAMMRPGLPDPERDYLNPSHGEWPHPADGRTSTKSVPELIRAASLAAARALALVGAIRAGADPREGWESIAGGADHGGMPADSVMRYRVPRT